MKEPAVRWYAATVYDPAKATPQDRHVATGVLLYPDMVLVPAVDDAVLERLREPFLVAVSVVSDEGPQFVTWMRPAEIEDRRTETHGTQVRILLDGPAPVCPDTPDGRAPEGCPGCAAAGDSDTGGCAQRWQAVSEHGFHEFHPTGDTDDDATLRGIHGLIGGARRSAPHAAPRFADVAEHATAGGAGRMDLSGPVPKWGKTFYCPQIIPRCRKKKHRS